MKPTRFTISPELHELARRAGDGALRPGPARAARARLADALDRPESAFPRAFRRAFRRASTRAWAPAFAIAAVAMAALLITLSTQRLRFDVTGAAIAEASGYVIAPDAAPARIAFTDGTTVDLAPRATVRVAHAGLRGADLVQERGRATYAVVHRPAASWSIAAGPYRVKVTGTRFSVTWAPDPGELITELYEGSVIVDGPSAESGIPLRAGQRLRASITGAVLVEPLPASDPAPTPDAAPASPPASPPAPSSPGDSLPSDPGIAPAPGSLPAAPAPDALPSSLPDAPPPDRRPLAERLAAGEASAIADEVEREGIDSFAARASAHDLAIVADAARYARRPALANAAMNAIRARHPGTREAATAAFYFGRSADDAGQLARAITWYDTYLTETAGSGPFAIEVRGRKMSAVARHAGSTAARPLAEAYLALHPAGPHAALARTLLTAQ